MGASIFRKSLFFSFLFLAVSGLLKAEEPLYPLDEETALYEELQQEKAQYLRREQFRQKLKGLQSEDSLAQNVGLVDGIKKIFGGGTKKSASNAPILRAIPIDSNVHVEVLKVKTNSSGGVTDSILGVTDRDGIPQEIVLVTIDGRLTYVWPTSTAQSYKKRKHNKRGWITPSTSEGLNYRPQSLVRYKSSTAYGDGTVINMPYAIFFNGGIALHGTTADHYNELGEKDSGGCARLYQPHASILWSLVNPTREEEIYGGSTLSSIQSKVRIDVYGFDRMGPETRANLRAKYGQSIPWIQQQLIYSLDQIASRQ